MTHVIFKHRDETTAKFTAALGSTSFTVSHQHHPIFRPLIRASTIAAIRPVPRYDRHFSIEWLATSSTALNIRCRTQSWILASTLAFLYSHRWDKQTQFSSLRLAMFA